MVDGGDEMNVDVDQDAYGLPSGGGGCRTRSLSFPTVAEWHCGSAMSPFRKCKQSTGYALAESRPKTRLQSC